LHSTPQPDGWADGWADGDGPSGPLPQACYPPTLWHRPPRGRNRLSSAVSCMLGACRLGRVTTRPLRYRCACLRQRSSRGAPGSRCAPGPRKPPRILRKCVLPLSGSRACLPAVALRCRLAPALTIWRAERCFCGGGSRCTCAWRKAELGTRTRARPRVSSCPLWLNSPHAARRAAQARLAATQTLARPIRSRSAGNPQSSSLMCFRDLIDGESSPRHSLRSTVRQYLSTA